MKKRNLIIFLVLLLLVDQIVKILVKTNMTLDQYIPIFGKWFYIRFIENPGAAFGFEFGGNYGKLFLSVFRIVAVGFIIWYLNRLTRRADVPKGVLIGLGLILAGALGNIIDSAFYGLIFNESGFTTAASLFPAEGGYAGFLHGKVVDMLYFPIIKNAAGQTLFFSPVFNFADAYISVGVIYLLLFQRKFFGAKQE
ncbi:MAG: lipoprotein signal peptidase [Rikenellaceae bacterium]|jgi:signal peptidase II|nr:lipoprotein signal peptidase [Rikenellaceae bacterium]